MAKISRIDIYPIQDPVGPNDRWIGTRDSDGKTMNFSSEAVGDAIGDQLGLSNKNTGLISVDQINVTDLNVEVVNAYYKIVGEEYFAATTDLTIEPASEGFYRIDNIIGHVGGTIAVEQGEEDENNPAQLPVSPTTVLIGTIYVYGEEATAAIPPVTDLQLKSTETQFKVYWTGTIGQSIWNQYNTYRWSAATGSSTLVSMSTSAGTQGYLYDGRMFYIVNDTAGAGSLTIKHLSGAGNIQFFMPDASDLVIAKGYIAGFKYHAINSYLGRLELVSFSNINEVDTTNFFKKDPSPETEQTITGTIIYDSDNTSTQLPNDRAVTDVGGIKQLIEDKLDITTVTIQAATVENVRNDQPSYVELDNGDILCAFNHFGEAGSDIDTAYIAGKISTDGMKTWGDIFALQEVISGTDNVLVPSLHKRADGKILMLFFAQTEPVPTPESRIYKKLFNQDMTVFSGPTDLSLPTGYYGGVGCDRIFLDETNGNLLYPVGRLLSGDGTSYGSVYESTILVSEDDGDAWTDLDLHIGSTKLRANSNFGGGTEPGIHYTPQGLVCYFRTLLGSTYGVRLDENYEPTGEEFVLFPSSNAMSSIKWITSLNMAVAGCTRLIENNPIGDNVRKYLDLLVSTDGLYNWSFVNEIDHAIEDVNWYVNQPVIFEYAENIVVGYNNSKTGPLTASLFNKIYPKSFIKDTYIPQPYSGLTQDRGKVTVGMQAPFSTDNTKNIVTAKNPLGGSYYASTSPTGAFKITFPNNRNANVCIKGRVFCESISTSFSFEIRCNTSDMTNFSSARVDYPELARSLNIRFVNGTKPQVLIGDLSSAWVKPAVIIDEVTASGAAYLNELREGWKVELEAASYGTVAYSVNSADNSWLRSTTLKITNPPSGAAITVDRAGAGFYLGVGSGIDGWIIYNLAGTTAFQRIFSNGNHIIGSSIGTDNGYKLEIQGSLKATTLNLTGLPEYANEAAAVTGGLVSGDVYKTATGELRIKL